MIFPILLIVCYSIIQYNIKNKQGIFLDVIILLLICWIELRIQIIQARAQLINQNPPACNNQVDPLLDQQRERNKRIRRQHGRVRK